MYDAINNVPQSYSFVSSRPNILCGNAKLSHAIKPFSADKEERDYLKRIFNYKKVERLHPRALFF